MQRLSNWLDRLVCSWEGHYFVPLYFLKMYESSETACWRCGKEREVHA